MEYLSNLARAAEAVDYAALMPTAGSLLYLVGLPWLATSLALLSLLSPIITIYECVWAAAPLSVILTGFIGYIVAALRHDTTLISVLITYQVWTAIAVAALSATWRRTGRLLGLYWNELLYNAWLNPIIIGALVFFSWLFHSRMLYAAPKPPDGITWFSGGGAWADLSFHLNVIHSFIYGQNSQPSFGVRPASPILSGHSMSYPFIPDLHSMILIVSGVSLQTTLIVPSVVVAVGMVVMIYRFNLRWIIRPAHLPTFWAGVSVFIALLSGGIGALHMLQQRGWQAGTSVSQLESEDWVQRDTDGSEIFWWSLICHILVPQRGSLLAYPVALFIWILLLRGSSNSEPISLLDRTILFITAGFCTGLLPLVHTHTLVAVGVTAGVFALLLPSRLLKVVDDGLLLPWLGFGSASLGLAAPQLPYLLDRIEAATSFVRWAPVWEDAGFVNLQLSLVPRLILLWWRAIAFLLPVLLVGVLVLFCSRSDGWLEQRRVVVAGFVLVAISHGIAFQPWLKDNLKLFALVSLGAAGLASAVLGWLWHRGRWWSKLCTRPLAVVLFALLIFSGLSVVLRERTMQWAFLTEEDVAVGMWARTNIPADAVVLTSDDHIQGISAVGGKTIFLGFGGWLYSHGYPDQAQRRADVCKMVDGSPESLALMRQYNIHYVDVDQRLMKQCLMNPRMLEKMPESRLVFRSSQMRHRVYYFDLDGSGAVPQSNSDAAAVVDLKTRAPICYRPVRIDNDVCADVPSIFISVASYRDDQCSYTVIDAHRRARCPHKLVVGVVQQNSEKVDADCIYDMPICESDGVDYGTPDETGMAVGADGNTYYHYKDVIKMWRYDYGLAKGPAYARWQASTMWRGEDYFLQVDSHTRFTPGWDESLVRQIKATPSYPLSVITHYPIDFNPLADQLDESRLRDMPVLCNMEWNSDGIPELRASSHTILEHGQHTLTPFVSANFFFASSDFLREDSPNAVLFDPHLEYVFMGEEPLLSLRFWTAGWDIWTPTENTCFHYYTRSDQPKFWEYIPDYNAKSALFLQRVRTILELPDRPAVLSPPYDKDLHKFGAGTKRTVDQWYALGIDRDRRLVNPKWCNSASPHTYEELISRGFGLPF